MSSKHLTILLALAALLLTASCGNDDNDSLFAEGQVAAQVKADICDGQTVTRVSIDGDDASFTAGDVINVVASEKDTYKYTLSDGAWSANPPYYFQDHSDVTFRGWYATSTPTENIISINTAKQTTTNDWNDWDILVTPEVTANVSSPSVDFTGDNAFQHIMSQVSFTFTAGNGVSDLSSLKGYTLKSVSTEASFNTLTCKLEAGSTTGDITQEVSATSVSEYDCDPIILVPQTVSGNLLLEVSFNSQTYYAELTLPSDSEDELQAGIHYAFSVTIDNTGLVVNSVEIKNWATPETDIADAWLSRPDFTIDEDENGVITYIVYNEAGLREWAAYVAEGNYYTNCTVAADFYMTDTWTAVGTNISTNAYKGTFDGQGYTIYNLTINASSPQYQGLIGALYDDGNGTGVVKNLNLVDVSVTYTTIFGNSATGAVVGNNNGGTVSNCTVTGKVSGSYYTGGVVGGSTGTVENCYSAAEVTGSGDFVGGVVGSNSAGGTLTDCYATGTVTNSGSYTGGVAGANYGSSSTTTTIIGCYSTATVSGNHNVGGVTGYNTFGTVTACYATDSVKSSGNYVGGVVGRNYNSGTVIGCYSTATVEGNNYVGGVVGHNSQRTSKVIACYATGTVSGTGNYRGVVGYKYGQSTMTACYNGSSTSDSNATQVNGTTVTWETAASAMNSNSDMSATGWQYKENDAYEEDAEDDTLAPLLLVDTTSTTTE